MVAARWITVSTPRSACLVTRGSPSSSRSPSAIRTSTRSRPRRRGSRTSTLTSSPVSSSRGTSALPTVPVAPVTRIIPPDSRMLRSRDLRHRKGRTPLAYVIADPCIGQKDNSCVEVCPVDCIHPTPDEPDYENVEQLFIDPDECIDCDACVEACPVDACFAEDQLPEEWQKYTQINLDYYKSKA